MCQGLDFHCCWWRACFQSVRDSLVSLADFSFLCLSFVTCVFLFFWSLWRRGSLEIGRRLRLFCWFGCINVIMWTQSHVACFPWHCAHLSGFLSSDSTCMTVSDSEFCSPHTFVAKNRFLCVFWLPLVWAFFYCWVWWLFAVLLFFLCVWYWSHFSFCVVFPSCAPRVWGNSKGHAAVLCGLCWMAVKPCVKQLMCVSLSLHSEAMCKTSCMRFTSSMQWSHVWNILRAFHFFRAVKPCVKHVMFHFCCAVKPCVKHLMCVSLL